MRRVALVLVVVALGLGGTVAAAAMDMGGGGSGPAVGIAYAAYSPTRIDVVAGQTITWDNTSVRIHTVTADDGSWSSMHLSSGTRYSHAFDTTGTFLYHCQLHPFMRGEVDVHEVLLDQPASVAGPGRPYPLTGRAAAPPDSAVTIEADEGAGFHAVGSATTGADGTFVATVTPRATTSYRAVADGQPSPPVQLVVLDRKVKVSVTTRRGRSLVSATVTPASPGTTIVLQLRLRDRFGWWPMQQHRLDAHSRTRFVLRFPHRVPARVLLTLPDGATPLAVSRTVHIGRG